MDMFVQILIWVLGFYIAYKALKVIVAFMVVKVIRRLQRDFEINQWYQFESLQQITSSEFLSRLAIYHLYRLKQVTVRFDEREIAFENNTDEFALRLRDSMEQWCFAVNTVPLYEFQLISRGGKKKPRRILPSIRDIIGGLRPARLPNT